MLKKVFRLNGNKLPENWSIKQEWTALVTMSWMLIVIMNGTTRLQTNPSHWEFYNINYLFLQKCQDRERLRICFNKGDERDTTTKYSVCNPGLGAAQTKTAINIFWVQTVNIWIKTIKWSDNIHVKLPDFNNNCLWLARWPDLSGNTQWTP